MEVIYRLFTSQGKEIHTGYCQNMTWEDITSRVNEARKLYPSAVRVLIDIAL